MSRVFNFSAGPGTLPEPVLERIRDDALDWNGTGMSVMEHSHRGGAFKQLAGECEQKLRTLAGIPEDYYVIFMHGPARIHFSAVPLNLAGDGSVADYLDTGIWSRMAVKEAGRHCKVNLVATAEDTKYDRIPERSAWTTDDRASYFHYTPNETINGVEFHELPAVGDVPLVADMSSNILSQPLDISKFGLIYAGAQKNCGISGLSIVIVRKDLLERKMSPHTPEMLNYKAHAEADSLLATAPTFPWYVAALVFDWIEAEGGLAEMGARNARKASKLYDFLDNSNFYANPVARNVRSRMNIPFTLADDALDKTFLSEARAEGLSDLGGHRFVGGMRASIYNAMPEAGVDALLDFMQEFVRRHG